MRYMKTVVVAIAALFGLQALAEGNTWYVDNDNYGKPGMDGTKPETAYGTIQDAITNKTTEAGDTILVLPGVYDQGVARATASGGKSRLTRVFVTKANLTVRSTKGPDVTHIVGRFGAGAGEDGDDISCVCVSGKSCVLDGFTLRNGSAWGGF